MFITIKKNIYYQATNKAEYYYVRMTCPITKKRYTNFFSIDLLGEELAFKYAITDLNYINARIDCMLPIHY